MNVKWIKSRNIGFGGRAVRKFLLLYRETLYNIKRKAKKCVFEFYIIKLIFSIGFFSNSRSRNEVMMMLRRNPNIDIKIIRSKYPDVDVDKLLRDDKTRGHFVPKVDI